MIRKDDILKMTEKGISVFRYYLPVDFKVGKNFLNPFYKDTKASCNIYYERKAGVFKMKDFGNEDYSWGTALSCGQAERPLTARSLKSLSRSWK